MPVKIAEAVHKEGIKKLSVEDRKAIENEVSELEEQLTRAEPGNDTAPRPDMLQMIPQLKQKKKNLEEMLNKDDDLIAKGPDKDILKKRVKEIEAIIKKDMPTEREQQLREKAGMDFERAVIKTQDHQKRYGGLIQEWQELKRRLEPEDPNAADTRNLL